MIHKLHIALLIGVLTLPLTVTSGLADEADSKDQTETKVFAKVGDTVITMIDYQLAFMRAAREEFYHGKPARSQVAALQREVGKRLVDDVFLVNEAKRRGIKADASFVEKEIKVFVENNKENPKWEKEGEKVVSRLRKIIEDREMLKSLKKAVIDEMPNPSEEAVRKFFTDNQQLFTEPGKMRVWIILLKVDPGASPSVKGERKNQAIKIISRLNKGEDFETLAKRYSDDKTRKKGGDMGFIHKGVLAGKGQAEAKRLASGEFSSEPIRLLEGYAIFKKGGTISPKLHKFEDVKDRAGRLLTRELKKSTWENLKVNLSKGVPVEVNETFYEPLAGHAGKNKVEEGHN